MDRSQLPVTSKPVPDAIYAQAAEWLDALSDQPIDSITARRFNNWLQQDPRHQLMLDRMLHTWQNPALVESIKQAEASFTLKDRYRLMPAPRRTWWAGVTAAACAACLVLSLLLAPQQPSAPTDNAIAVIAVETPVAEVRDLQLADGSQLAVNAASSLSVRMSSAQRLVELKRGSTYFAVAPDKTRPFTVSIEQASVVAVGTEFNIDKTSSGIDVTVYEGAIEVRATPHSSPTLVKAGEHVRITGARVSQIQTVELDHLLDWRSGWIEIQDSSLPYLLEQIGRYSNKPIQLKDAELAKLRVAGRFQLNDPQATLALLSELYSLTTTEHEEGILIGSTAL